MNNYHINGWYLLKYKYYSLCVRAGPAGEVERGVPEYKAPKFTIIVYILYGHSTGMGALYLEFVVMRCLTFDD